MIAADNDPVGIDMANQAAKDIGAAVVFPPEGDFNDLYEYSDSAAVLMEIFMQSGTDDATPEDVEKAEPPKEDISPADLASFRP